MKQEILKISSVTPTGLKNQLDAFVSEGYFICFIVKVDDPYTGVEEDSYIIGVYNTKEMVSDVSGIVNESRVPHGVLLNGKFYLWSDFTGKTVSESDKVIKLYS